MNDVIGWMMDPVMIRLMWTELHRVWRSPRSSLHGAGRGAQKRFQVVGIGRVKVAGSLGYSFPQLVNCHVCLTFMDPTNMTYNGTRQKVCKYMTLAASPADSGRAGAGGATTAAGCT